MLSKPTLLRNFSDEVECSGWQTAAQVKHQFYGLSDTYRVIAVDMRGHGDSKVVIFEAEEGGSR